MKVGRIWHLGAAVGSCGSARVHAAADCWTFPVEVTTQIVGWYGFILVHGAYLARYALLDPISTIEVSGRGSGGAKVRCLGGVGIGVGLQRLAGKFKPFFYTNHYR